MPFRVGNGVHTLKKGHILLGEVLVPGVVIHSLQHYERLYERIKKATQRGGQPWRHAGLDARPGTLCP